MLMCYFYDTQRVIFLNIANPKCLEGQREFIGSCLTADIPEAFVFDTRLCVFVEALFERFIIYIRHKND